MPSSLGHVAVKEARSVMAALGCRGSDELFAPSPSEALILGVDVDDAVVGGPARTVADHLVKGYPSGIGMNRA